MKCEPFILMISKKFDRTEDCRLWSNFENITTLLTEEYFYIKVNHFEHTYLLNTGCLCHVVSLSGLIFQLACVETDCVPLPEDFM